MKSLSLAIAAFAATALAAPFAEPKYYSLQTKSYANSKCIN